MYQARSLHTGGVDTATLRLPRSFRASGEDQVSGRTGWPVQFATESCEPCHYRFNFANSTS